MISSTQYRDRFKKLFFLPADPQEQHDQLCRSWSTGFSRLHLLQRSHHLLLQDIWNVCWGDRIRGPPNWCFIFPLRRDLLLPYCLYLRNNGRPNEPAQRTCSIRREGAEKNCWDLECSGQVRFLPYFQPMSSLFQDQNHLCCGGANGQQIGWNLN